MSLAIRTIHAYILIIEQYKSRIDNYCDAVLRSLSRSGREASRNMAAEMERKPGQTRYSAVR